MISLKNSWLSTISLELGRKRFLFRAWQVTDSRFAHEVEAGAMHSSGFFPLRIATEKDRRPKDSLKGGHETPVLGTVLLHAEGIEHLGRTAKPEDTGLLADGESRKKDGNESILAPWQTVGGMAGDLKQEVSVAALMEQLSRLRSFNRQAAQDEWSRSEPKGGFLPFQPHAGDGLSAAEPLL